MPFAFKVADEEGKRKYDAQFQLRTTDPELYYLCTVTVARAGRLLSAKEIERIRKEVSEHDSQQSDPEFRFGDSFFPSIGKRALAGFATGPGGGGCSIVFTTSDGRWDIDVGTGNRMREGMEEPGLDVDRLAQQTCNLYDRAMGR